MKVKVDYFSKEIDLEDYLYSLLEFHSKHTPYWKRKFEDKKIKPKDIIDRNFNSIISNLLNYLEVDQEDLRNRWLDFLPQSEDVKNLRISQSSGTTGKRKFCYWSSEYINTLVDYLDFYLDKIYRVPRKVNAIIHGPYGVFQSVNQRLINKRGGIPYAISIETSGLKPIFESVSPEKLKGVVYQYFKPLIEDTKRYLECDKNIQFLRSGWMFLYLFDELFENRENNIKYVMTSGMNYSLQQHQLLSSKWKIVIPSYGYFAFGDALGIFENGELSYYPPFPYALFSVVNEENEVVKYGEIGNPAFIIARKECFLVIKEKDEIAKKAIENQYFKWEGISNPRREFNGKI